VSKNRLVQAGRGVRIIVNPGSVSDGEATMIAREVAKRIENQMTYPGQIRLRSSAKLGQRSLHAERQDPEKRRWGEAEKESAFDSPIPDSRFRVSSHLVEETANKKRELNKWPFR
jgi:hypothetical protein